jgi:hypothetical protein
MSLEASNFDTELFFIAPIGEEGSPERKRSNNVFVGVVEEAAAKVEGFKHGSSSRDVKTSNLLGAHC